MEADILVMTIIIILCGLIFLSLLFWALRLIWEVMRSPVAFAILVALLALTVSLTALQAMP
jgi:uncharacterized membrane protein YwzB